MPLRRQETTQAILRFAQNEKMGPGAGAGVCATACSGASASLGFYGPWPSAMFLSSL